MTKKSAKIAAGVFAASVILIATWRYQEAAIAAVASAFALLGALLGVPGLGG